MNDKFRKSGWLYITFGAMVFLILVLSGCTVRDTFVETCKAHGYDGKMVVTEDCGFMCENVHDYCYKNENGVAVKKIEITCEDDSFFTKECKPILIGLTP